MIDWKRTINLSITDQKSVIEKALKTSEETGELAQASLSYSGAHACGYKGKSKEDIVKEAVDVIQCAISVIAKVYEEEGFPKEKFINIYNNKLDKWEAKQKADS